MRCIPGQAMVRAVAELRIASALDAGTLAREAEPATIVVVRAAAGRYLFRLRPRACAPPSATAPGST